jgi:glycopeptide antibiotics resistance protein
MKAAYENFKNGYLDFNMLTVCVVGLLLFAIYLLILRIEKSSWTKGKLFFGVCWSFYLLIIITSTILNRNLGGDNLIELELFWSYKEAMNSQDSVIVWQILYNVFMFIPWGIFLANKWECMRKPLWNIGSALLMSITIEVIQLLFQCGTVELDDVFHNVMGGVTGYSFWRVYYDIKNKKMKR